MNEYEKRVTAQIRQFQNPALRLFPPAAHLYWMDNYVFKKVNAVFGTTSPERMYVQPLLDRAEPLRILSVGSGDGDTEIKMAHMLFEHGIKQFTIAMTELSPVRQDRAKALIRQNGLEEHFEWHLLDLNKEYLDGSFDLIFAHHVLHHIVELEFLFENISKSLKPGGTFSSIDMIGRNGHMRWEETKYYIDLIWNFMPDAWKYNFQLRDYHENFLNFDCSQSGFEGIRAQDILPLLVEKFNFRAFVAEGGFLDILLERGYGQSIDMDNKRDASLVQFLCETNELLVESLRTKPTMMFAEMCRKDENVQETKVWKSMTPENCIRPV